LKHFFNLQAVVAGTGIAAGATALSFALAAWGFGNLYYVSVFMPFAMLACLAVAWFSFLRDDGFARRLPEAGPAASGALPAEPRPAEPLMVAGLGTGTDGASHGAGPAAGSATGRLDPALFAPRDGTLVSGRTGGADERPGSLGRTALFWAAVELGAVSALLYSVAGLGARFFR
jgi:hypothetical protein